MTCIGIPARNAGRSVWAPIRSPQCTTACAPSAAASHTARSSASARSWLSETMQIFTRRIIVHKDYSSANGPSRAVTGFNLRPAACMHSRRARMRAAEIAVRVAMPGVMALLAVYAGEAAAQAYSPQALERFEAAPPLALQLSPSGMRELDELHGVDMFGGKRRVDPFERSLEQRPQAWTLFGRLGVIHYQNQLDRDSGSGGGITLKRSRASIRGTPISLRIRRRLFKCVVFN